jgi:hypothetical protein
MAKHMANSNDKTSESKKDRDKTRFTTKMVIASVSATTIFTIACFCLAVYNIDHLANVQMPAELTTLFFAFWTVDIVSLGTTATTSLTPGFGQTFSVTGISVNSTGHTTAAGSHTVTIPGTRDRNTLVFINAD